MDRRTGEVSAVYTNDAESWVGGVLPTDNELAPGLRLSRDWSSKTGVRVLFKNPMSQDTVDNWSNIEQSNQD